jgi:hypothetical protein
VSKFQPSVAPRTAQLLVAARRAVEALEAQALVEGGLPSWVETRIGREVQELATAAAYVPYAQQRAGTKAKKFEPSGES